MHVVSGRYAFYLFEALVLTIVVFGTLLRGDCSYFAEAPPHNFRLQQLRLTMIRALLLHDPVDDLQQLR
jgi:hypothetical protein